MNKKNIFRIVSLVIIIFYALWTIYQVINPGPNPELIFDRLTGVLFFGVLFFLNEKVDLHWLVFILLILAFNLHNAGLYGTYILGLEADMVIHFLTNFASTMLVYNFFYSARMFSKTSIKRIWLGIIIFFFITGIGAFTEIFEFIGYSIIGEGEGFLAYGTGDFGEWNDLSWDMISNCLGSLTGIILFNLLRLKKWIKRKK